MQKDGPVPPIEDDKTKKEITPSPLDVSRPLPSTIKTAEEGERLEGGYQYPDPGEHRTLDVLEQVGVEKGDEFWGKDEARVLAIAKQIVATEINNSDSVLIDAGCGSGRLIPEFQQYFSEVIAVEPDAQRLQWAVQNMIEANLTEKVKFQNKTIEGMEVEKPVDAIVCSHILQHVPTKSIPKVLHKINQSLKDKGLLILATNYSQEEEDTYAKAYWNGTGPAEDRIDENEFNGLIQNDQEILPVHSFSDRTFDELMRENGFEIIDKKPFHNWSKQMKGRDIQIIARKVSQEAI